MAIETVEDAGPTPLFSDRLERASRRAAAWHRSQSRKGSDLPYFQHLAAVALILDRLGFDEAVVIAGFLHDAEEDTDATFDRIESEFGPVVAVLVRHASERKRDEAGAPRPWAVRKAEHLEALATAPVEARALVLADKLHNLLSIRVDLEAGADPWSRFNAPKAAWLVHYRALVDRLGVGDARLEQLGVECLAVIAELDPFACLSRREEGLSGMRTTRG